MQTTQYIYLLTFDQIFWINFLQVKIVMFQRIVTWVGTKICQDAIWTPVLRFAQVKIECVSAQGVLDYFTHTDLFWIETAGLLGALIRAWRVIWNLNATLRLELIVFHL